MSFGFSVGDIITLMQLTTRTYNGWKNACGEYGDITSNLAVLQTLLMRIEAEAQAPNSLIARNTEDFGGWKTLYKSCHTLVIELEEVLDKYKSLGTNHHKNWDRIRLGNRNLDGLSKRLVGKTASLSAYISVLGISSQARVENDVLPELLQKIDHMATQMRRGNSSIRSALTTYEDDDKVVWREFRRELIGTGIRSREIHKYSAALKTYLSRLQRDGLLDEEVPLERDEEVPLERDEEIPLERDEDSRRVQTPEIQAPHSENDSLLDLPAEKINQSPPLGGTDEIKYPAGCSADIEYDDFSEALPDELSKQAKDLEAQVTEKKNILREEHPDTLTLMAELGSTYWSQGRWKKAEKLELQVFKARKKVLGHKHLDTLSSMHNLAAIFQNQGKYKKAEELGVQVIDTQKKVLGHEHPDTLASMNILALTYQGQGRYKESEKLGVQVLEARKKVLGHEHPDTLASMNILVLTYQGQGRYKESEKLGVQVLEARKKVLGHEHPDTLASMNILVVTYQGQGRYKESEKLGVQVIETRKKVLGHEHPDTLASMSNLALTYRKQGRYKKSEKLCIRVIEAKKRVVGPKHPDTLVSMHNLAWVYVSQKRYTEAEELEVQVIEIRKKVLGPEHPKTLLTMTNLAFTYWEQGRWKEAEELGVKAVESQKKVLGPKHPDTLRSLADIENIRKSTEKSRV